MRRSSCALVAVLLARGLAAQAAGEPNPRHNWVDHLYPAIWYSSIDGFWLAGHYDWSSPMGFAERLEPTFARIALDAGASTEGRYSIVADARARAYWGGCRRRLAGSRNGPASRRYCRGISGQRTRLYTPDRCDPRLRASIGPVDHRRPAGGRRNVRHTTSRGPVHNGVQ